VVLATAANAYSLALKQSWMDIKCPDGCFLEYTSNTTQQCVCPALGANKPLNTTCDPTIENCAGDAMVRIVEVDVGFQYNPSAEMYWMIMGVTIMLYSSFVASPFETTTDLETAWTYNFFWMFLTWGISIILLGFKMLLKSEGDFFHKWFNTWVGLGAINTFVAYWAIDLLIVRGTLDYTPAGSDSKTPWYLKFVILLIMQFVTTFIQYIQKASINFDYELAIAEPQEYVPSGYEPPEEEESELEIPEDAPVQEEKQVKPK
jgi:hypothetical protein